jgi:predicted transcriptional regulator
VVLSKSFLHQYSNETHQRRNKPTKPVDRALIRWLDERATEPSEIADIFSISSSTLSKIRKNTYKDNLDQDKHLRAGMKTENSESTGSIICGATIDCVLPNLTFAH